MTNRPFRVLSLDGGGIRGLYTAALLNSLANSFAAYRGLPPDSLDIGKGFDLIVGTSTGGIIACGLARGLPTDHIIKLYRTMGRSIFRSPMPQGQLPLFMWMARHLNSPANDSSVLSDELNKLFGKETTMLELWDDRNIALCIPAVNMKTQKSWVFKTPHDNRRVNSRMRDGEYRVVDVCLATSAAPLYFPLASVSDPMTHGANYAFADGGLWANNPVIVGLVEALEFTAHADPCRPIEIISVSTCSPPSGEPILPTNTSWGVVKWQAGSKALMASLYAQSSRYTGIANVLANHLRHPCRVLRLEGSSPSPEQANYMSLDCTTDEAMDVLTCLACSDADDYFGKAVNSTTVTSTEAKSEKRCIDHYSILRDAFMDMPIASSGKADFGTFNLTR